MSECWCGAAGSAPCRTKAGRPLRQPHKSRTPENREPAGDPPAPETDRDHRLRLGSLFSGYGGLDQGVSAITGARTVWVSDIDGAPTKKRTKLKGACAILAHRYPDVPNLGDVSHIDWAAVEPVEILTGGFPCQDVSHAGKRAGMIRGETRTGLWAMMLKAIVALQPRLVVAENVKGLLNAKADSDLEPCPWCVGDNPDGYLRALGAVLADLAEVGYDARWVCVRASDLGATHQRLRVFIVAYPAGTDHELRGLIQPGAHVPAMGGFPDLSDLLPTPQAQDSEGHTPENRGNRIAQGRQLQLAHVVPLPTPTATAIEANQQRAETAGQSLGQAVGLYGDGNRARPNDPPPLLGTPRVSMKQGSSPKGRVNDRSQIENQVQLLPTPLEDDKSNVTRASGSFQSLTRTVAEDLPVLPTPKATNNENRTTWDPATGNLGSAVNTAAGVPPKVAAADLPLLPTPVTFEDRTQSSEKRDQRDRDGQHRDLSRVAKEELLPTPTAWEQRSDPAVDDRNLLPLAVQRIERDDLRCVDCGCSVDFHDEDGFCAGRCGGELCRGERFVANLLDVPLLPTPAVNDMGEGKTLDEWDDWNAGETMRSQMHGQPLSIVAQDMDRTQAPRESLRAPREPTGSPWGQYAPAIARWELILGRPAPEPTVPGLKPGPDGVIRPRLNSRFVEWMMGLPEGWVCDVPGLSRNEHLHALGNGVVPQQAAAAVVEMLTAAALTDEELAL